MHACAPLQCFVVESTSLLHIMADVGNMDTKAIVAICQSRERDCIIEILRILGIDCETDKISEVKSAAILRSRDRTRNPFCFMENFWREVGWQVERTRNGKHFCLCKSSLTEHLDHFSLGVEMLRHPRLQCNNNLVAIVSIHKGFTRDVNVASDLRVVRDNEVKVLAALKATDDCRPTSLDDFSDLPLNPEIFFSSFPRTVCPCEKGNPNEITIERSAQEARID